MFEDPDLQSLKAKLVASKPPEITVDPNNIHVQETGYPLDQLIEGGVKIGQTFTSTYPDYDGIRFWDGEHWVPMETLLPDTPD